MNTFKVSFTHTIHRLLVLIAASAVSNPILAEELPLWELGLGLGGLSQPYYPGSDETRSYLFPVPLPVYRGDIFKSDDDGMRAELIQDERYKLDISLDFNLAINSEDVALRNGMEDIDSMLQIGPSLEYKLQEDVQNQWLLKLPLRANFGIGGDGIESAGYTIAPNITYFRKFAIGEIQWRAGLAIGPQFGSSEYQNVYYGVTPAFVTENRPQYRADTGYSGTRALFTLKSHNKKRLWVWFVRYDNISGATFEDSPLVANDGRLSFGVIYSRYLFKSKEMVNR